MPLSLLVVSHCRSMESQPRRLRQWVCPGSPSCTTRQIKCRRYVTPCLGKPVRSAPPPSYRASHTAPLQPLVSAEPSCYRQSSGARSLVMRRHDRTSRQSTSCRFASQSEYIMTVTHSEPPEANNLRIYIIFSDCMLSESHVSPQSPYKCQGLRLWEMSNQALKSAW